MKVLKIAFIATMFCLVTSLCSAGEYFYVEKAYTKDEMSLGLMCEAIFDKDDKALKFLYETGMLKLVEEKIEVHEVKIIPRSEAMIELPRDMVTFKIKGDYRTFYTIDSFLTRILR